MLFCRLLIFLKINFFLKKSFRNIIIVSNSLEPDQARHYVGPDLGLNCIDYQQTTKVATDWKELLSFKNYFIFFSRHIKTQQQKPVPQRETDTEYDEGSSIIIYCYILLFILIDVTANPTLRSRLSHSSDDWFLSFLATKEYHIALPYYAPNFEKVKGAFGFDLSGYFINYQSYSFKTW